MRNCQLISSYAAPPPLNVTINSIVELSFAKHDTRHTTNNNKINFFFYGLSIPFIVPPLLLNGGGGAAFAFVREPLPVPQTDR